MPSRPLSIVAILVVGALAACDKPREERAPVTYATDVKAIFDARCVRCHAGSAPAGGWAADSYLGAIGCAASGAPATIEGPGSRARLLVVLDRADHAGLASAEDRAVLTAWITSGAPQSAGGVHGRSFADPRSPESHGSLLRRRRYAPMLDVDDADSCGACHDGAGARPARVRVGAPHAPPCTSCHAEPNGPFACGTCHGDGARAYPPRSACFFPGDGRERAHAAHAGATASRSAGLPCSACHPEPASGRPGGVHANGHVDVWFDFAVAGREARFDPTTKRCSGTCHARGGARPSPTWSDAPTTCNDCHASPPPGHYRGACTSCHREANTDGTALSTPVLHVNGRVDLGDGSGRCGACHGNGDDPWPTSGAHQVHLSPASGRPVECGTCHVVPSGEARHPEGRGSASVRFTGLAVAGGRRASFDPVTKTCASTYCHEGAGATHASPRWTETTSMTCTSCHGAPPPPPHAQSVSCGGAACHEGRTSDLAITPAGRPAHVDGVIDRGPP